MLSVHFNWSVSVRVIALAVFYVRSSIVLISLCLKFKDKKGLSDAFMFQQYSQYSL